MKSPTILILLVVLTSAYSLPQTMGMKPNPRAIKITPPRLEAANFINEGDIDAPFLSINKTIIEEKGSSPRLTLIGSYEGKSYYHDEIPRNWANSKQYCESLGLELAALTSSALWSFIYARIPSGEWYWTASKDSGLASQFNYFLKDSTVPQNYLPSVSVHSETCILVYGSASTYWLRYDCSYGYQSGVLCQTVN